jgi:hypothetical protein
MPIRQFRHYSHSRPDADDEFLSTNLPSDTTTSPNNYGDTNLSVDVFEETSVRVQRHSGIAIVF